MDTISECGNQEPTQSEKATPTFVPQNESTSSEKLNERQFYSDYRRNRIEAKWLAQQNDLVNQTQTVEQTSQVQAAQDNGIIEDYAANREIVNVDGEQLRPYIDENLVNEYIVSAKAGQTMTLQVAPAQRKEVREDALTDVGGLYLEIAALEGCKNVETLPLAWKTDKEVRGKFRVKLPKTGDYSVLVTSSQSEETGYRLKIIIE